MTAVTRSREQARARIRECLTANPGVTAQQLGRLLGLRSNAMRTLRAMLYDAEVIAVPEFRPQMGREVSTWHVAPPGTVPPPRPARDPAADARRRARETAAQRARRAKTSGKPAPFSSLQGAPVPTRRLDGPACADADPALFFPPAEYEPPPVRRRRVRLAANFCAACPVRAACYQGAAERLEPWGVWGGVRFHPDTRREAQSVMSRTPDPRNYVTKVDPGLTRKGGPLQVLSSPKPAAEPEPEAEAEI